jgi:hypothetical protein
MIPTSERLAERVVEHARVVEGDHAALDLVREPSEVVKPVRNDPKLREHLLVELAVVAHFDLRDLLGVLRDQVTPPHHQPTSTSGRERAPILAFEGGDGRANGSVDVLRPGKSMGRPRLAGRRIERIEGLARFGIDLCAADVQTVVVHRISLRMGYSVRYVR